VTSERDSLSYVTGVDLGTTFSAAAIAGPDGLESIDLGTRTMETPSIVAVRADGIILTGEAAERRAGQDPSRAAREFKRRLGDPTPLLLGGVPYGAESLTGHLLAAIVAHVAERQGESAALVGLSHPANYGAYKLDLLQEAARLAGIDSIVFVPEPVAAAVHYSQTERVADGDLIAVYDLGGGTFDASLVRRTDRSFEVIGRPDGIERFGGSDMDEAVLGHVRSVLGDDLLQVDLDKAAVRTALARLREECRSAKEGLSGDTEVAIPVMLPGLHTEVRLTRPEFEDMIRPRIRETIEVLDRTVASAGFTFGDLARVLLVGGSSRIPLVGEMIRQTTGQPIALDAHPKLTVALGAARMTQTVHEQAQPPAPVLVPGEPPESETGATTVAMPEKPPIDTEDVAEPADQPDGKGTEPKSDSRRRFTVEGRSFRWAAILLLVTVGVIVTSVFAMSRGDEPDATGAASTTAATSDASDPTLPSATGAPAVVGGDPFDRVMAYYSTGYRNPETDDVWTYWDAFNASPPDQICCDYFPELGPYSSTSTAVLSQHFAWFRQAGVGVIGYRWSGPASQSDVLLPTVLDIAHRYGLDVAFVIESYDGRDPETVVGDVAYLYNTYEDHSAFHWTNDATAHEAAGKKGVFLVTDPGAESRSPESWAPGLEAIHGLARGAVLLAEGTDVSWIRLGGFDGIFNAPDPALAGEFGWAATLPDTAWYVPTVMPGYEQKRSGGAAMELDRRVGSTYTEWWESALGAGVEPAFVVIASFNDWLAGTQIEPAATPGPAGQTGIYQDYGSLGSEGYLDLTAQLAASFVTASFPDTVTIRVDISSTSDWATVSIEGAIWLRPTEALFSGGEGSSWRFEWAGVGSPAVRLELGSGTADLGDQVRLVLNVQVPPSALREARLIIEQGCSGGVVIEINDPATDPFTPLAAGKGPEKCGGLSVVALSQEDAPDGTTTTTAVGNPTTSTTSTPVTTTTTSTTTTTTTMATTTTTPGSTAVVPNLVGKSRSQAIADLQALDLGYSETRGCYGAITGAVVSQSPNAGYMMQTGGGPGKTVFFESQFATGCSNTVVNNVVGLLQANAVASLEANNLVVSVNEGCHGGSSPGNVVSQSPAGGSIAPQGWTVTINVQATGCG